MRWLLSLYPRRWRERYEEEMLAVLEAHKVTPATVVDLLVGALDANLNYDGIAEGAMYMVDRLRSGIVMTFCAFILFGTGWGLLQRLTDPIPLFEQAAAPFPALQILFNAVFIVGGVAFLAFLIGGLPLLFISVKRAIAKKQRDVLNRFWVAVSCLLLFAVLTAALGLWHPHVYALIGYVILSGLLLIAGTVAVSQMLARTDFELSELKFAFIPEIVILFGMIMSVVLSTILIILVTTHAPQLFDTQDVSSEMFITGVVFMALGTIFAAIALRSGTIRGLGPSN
jgi:hypothetical protein